MKTIITLASIASMMFGTMYIMAPAAALKLLETVITIANHIIVAL